MNTFSEEIKMSLANSEMLFPQYEFYGAFIGRGDIIKSENKEVVKIKLTSINSLKRVYKIVKTFYTQEINVEPYKDKRLNLGNGGTIFLNKEIIEKPLKIVGLSLNKNKLPASLKNDPVIFGFFLKGLFLTCGSISIKEAYHLEFNFEASSSFFQEIVKTFNNLLGIKTRFIVRGEKAKLYLKSREDILNMIELMGAKESVTKLSQLMEIRNLRGDITRTLNFISANSTKIAESSLKQIRDIQIIKEKIGLESLPYDLKRIALYRLENQEASLSTIAEALNIKKPTLYNKFKKISKIAESLS